MNKCECKVICRGSVATSPEPEALAAPLNEIHEPIKLPPLDDAMNRVGKIGVQYRLAPRAQFGPHSVEGRVGLGGGND